MALKMLPPAHLCGLRRVHARGSLALLVAARAQVQENVERVRLQRRALRRTGAAAASATCALQPHETSRFTSALARRKSAKAP